MKFGFLILVLFSNLLAAQQSVFPNQNYQEGKISLLNFKKVNARNLLMENDSVHFFNVDLSESQSMSIADINYIRVLEGTQTSKIALLGGGASALMVISGLLQASTAPNTTLRPDAGKISAMFIAGGTLIGALIGALTPRWKTYYLDNQKLSKITLSPKIDYLKNNWGFTLKLGL